MSDFEVYGMTYNDLNVLVPFMQQDKTTLVLKKCIGIPDNVDNAVKSMTFEKQLYNRETEAQLHRVVVNISKSEMQIPVVMIADAISEAIHHLGFHHFMFIEEQGDDVLLNYLINSVNYLSGRRSTNSNKLCRKIREFLEISYR